MSTEMREKIKATARAHIDAYCSPTIWNAEKIWALRAPGCEHYLQPVSSLASEFHGNIDEDRHRHFMDFFGPCFTDFRMNIRWEIIDPVERIAAHGLDCVMSFKAFGDEPALEGYTAEYVWTIWTDESGTKITRVEEAVDLPRVIGYAAARAGRYAEYMKAKEEK